MSIRQNTAAKHPAISAGGGGGGALQVGCMAVRCREQRLPPLPSFLSFFPSAFHVLVVSVYTTARA